MNNLWYLVKWIHSIIIYSQSLFIQIKYDENVKE